MAPPMPDMHHLDYVGYHGNNNEQYQYSGSQYRNAGRNQQHFPAYRR
jgi:hypothetical protein